MKALHQLPIALLAGLSLLAQQGKSPQTSQRPQEGQQNPGQGTTRADSPSQGRSSSTRGSSSGAAADTLSPDDRMFIEEAAKGGQEEVEMGQMASTKASDAKVKNFAQMMVRDHTKANNELMGIARRNNVDLPNSQRTDAGGASRTESSNTSPAGANRPGPSNSPNSPPSASDSTTKNPPAAQAGNRNLSSYSGSDFDKQYMDAQVEAHRKTVDLFEKQANRSGNAELKKFAQNTLPTLRSHLSEAEAIHRNLVKK